MNEELGNSTLGQTFELNNHLDSTQFTTQTKNNETHHGHKNIFTNQDTSVEPTNTQINSLNGINVEKNLMKYLLESHASAVAQQHQYGQSMVPGPASVLLSQLGLELPNIPHDSRK